MVIYMTTTERDKDDRPKLHRVIAHHGGVFDSSVTFTVNLSDYAELKLLNSHEEFWVSGTIERCDHSISLKDVTDITPIPPVSER